MADENIGTTLIERRPALPVARPATGLRPVTGAPLAQPCQPPCPVDKLAIASAICGLVPVVPVLSQLTGIVLGIVAISRIRRARREGYAMGGLGWAITGLVSGIVYIIACVFTLIVLGGVLWMFAHTANTLNQIPVK